MIYAITWKDGDITQLVECMLCKHKVIGSIPIISKLTSQCILVLLQTLFKLDLNQQPSG